MKLLNRLKALGGHEKDGKIYITGFWEELLKAKVEFVFRNGNNRLQSFKVMDHELVCYGNDPKQSERTRRDLLNIRKSMAYVSFDVESGEFDGLKGADLHYLPKFERLVFVFHGKVIQVKL